MRKFKVGLALCAPEILAFADIEDVHWGKPGVTEQTPTGTKTRTFVFQALDGCPTMLVRVRGKKLVDLAYAGPSFSPEAAKALMCRAVSEGAKTFKALLGEDLERICRGLWDECLHSH